MTASGPAVASALAVLSNNSAGQRKAAPPSRRLNQKELNQKELQHARMQRDKLLVLLGALAKHEEVRKNTPVLGSPRSCRQEYVELLRVSKNALVQKHKREGLAFLDQGLHLHALASFQRAILLKRQPTSTPKRARLHQKQQGEAPVFTHFPYGGHSALLSPWSAPANAGSTTLSMDLGRVAGEPEGPCGNHRPQRNFFVSPHQDPPGCDGPHVYPQPPQPRRQHRQRNRTAPKKKNKRVVPSFFTALSPRHPRKTTFLRDPRRDPRRHKRDEPRKTNYDNS